MLPSLVSLSGGLLRAAAFLTLAAALVPRGWGQTQATAAAKPDYSQEAFVIAENLTSVTFENGGTSVREQSGRIRIQAQAGVQQFGVLIFYYPKANEQLEVGYVRVRKPDGSMVETPAANIQDMPADITKEAPFYSDIHERHVAVKGLAVGDILEYGIRSRLHTPLAPGQFWYAHDFNRENIVLEERLRLVLPRARQVIVKSPTLEPAVTQEGDHRVYTWKTANLEHKPKDAKQPKVGWWPPPAVQISTFRSWDEVGEWYESLQAERVKPTPEVRVKAAELTKGTSDESGKARAIYGYVATKFRYIGVAFGIGRYQPHAAAEVLANGYGDCKDKHILLASMLDAVGAKAYAALVSAGRVIDPEVPSPAQFDHVISFVPTAEGGVWLDTTAEVAPYGLLLQNIRNKQALVVQSKTAILMKTPADPPFRNSQLFEIEGKLSGVGTLQGRIKWQARGDTEVLFRSLFRRFARQQWTELAQGISYGSGFGGTVANVTASAPEATDTAFQFDYDYTREKFSDWENRRITPAFPPFRLPEAKEGQADAVELGPPADITYRGKIELPEGYVPQLPPPVDLQREFAEYHSSYLLVDGRLEARRRLQISVSEVPANRIQDYRAFRKVVADDEAQYIILQKPEEAATKASSKAEADRLYDQGRAAYQRQDFRLAADQFKRILAIDPKYQGAWLALGTVRLALNDLDEGLDAIRKEIELNPKDLMAYKVLGSALMGLQRTEEAIRVWRDLVQVDPHDRDGWANLGSILFMQKNFKEAVPALEEAVRANTETPELHATLGIAYLENGDKQKGVVALRKAADLRPEPGMWNNVAYMLADKRLELEEARHYAEMAVREVEDDSKEVELGKIETDDLRRMNSIAAYWDTLGWVHFQAGNLVKAEEYLSAAWGLSQHATVGDHLAQAYEKQGKRATAIRTYALAAAAGGLIHVAQRPSPPVVIAGNGAEGARSSLVRLLGTYSQATVAINKAREQLGRLRTMGVTVGTKKGTAEFFVLLSREPLVEDVKFISGSEELRPATKALAALRYGAAFPANSPARIVRRGILMCSGASTLCHFVLLTPDTVHSVK